MQKSWQVSLCRLYPLCCLAAAPSCLATSPPWMSASCCWSRLDERQTSHLPENLLLWHIHQRLPSVCRYVLTRSHMYSSWSLSFVFTLPKSNFEDVGCWDESIPRNGPKMLDRWTVQGVLCRFIPSSKHAEDKLHSWLLHLRNSKSM